MLQNILISELCVVAVSILSCWVSYNLVAFLDAFLLKYLFILFRGQEDSVPYGFERQVVRSNVHETFGVWKAVRNEWFDSWVRNLIFLHLGLSLEQYVTVLLLADQICLIKWIGFNLN